MDIVATLMILGFAVYFFRAYTWRVLKAKWYGTETNAVVSRIEEDVRSTGGIYYRCVNRYYYAVFQADNGLENEARLLNPKGNLDVGSMIRIRYLPEAADRAVLTGVAVNVPASAPSPASH